MQWFLKAVMGAVAAVLIQCFAQSRSFYIAGLVPLFPTFSLISHYIVGTERTVTELRQTILFGVASIVPYLIYLAAMYLLLSRFRLITAMLLATMLWLVAAGGLIVLWRRFVHVSLG